MGKNRVNKSVEKTYSQKQIEEALTTGKPTILELFLDEKVDDDDLLDIKNGYADKILSAYIQFSKDNLKGKCFIGVNVKTSSSEQLRPIPYRTTKESIMYVPDQDVIAEGGKITDLKKPAQEEVFDWDPGKWNYEDEKKAVDDFLPNEKKYKGAILGDVLSDEIIDHFRSPYGNKYDPQLGLYTKDTKVGNKYNILGDIYYNALGITQGACWVWLYHFDYDISSGKFLSFILAMGDKREDFETLMAAKIDENSVHESLNEADKNAWYSPRNLLRNYILLVKARYVRKIERLRQKESVKSAVAAIMSRNMSHNLGSHYLYYTKMQLSAMADKHKEFAPDIRGAARVLGYMQARMDYLATIVSGDKYPYGSVFFKGQIFDELTIDDFSKRHFEEDAAEPDRIYKRTTNYLLQNLILSEDFTRGPILDDLPNLLEEKNENDEITKKRKNIRLQIRIGDSQDGLFTGLPDILHQKKERKVKLEISKICMALPGGIMSIHAFFNVVENLIRNSAKYMKEDFKEELVETIAITELSEGESKSGKPLPFRYQFVIYDNKGNAFAPCASKSLIDKMNDELVDLKILNDKNELDKSNKGLKEMLFSTLWMRSYTRKESLADILARWDRMSVRSDEERSNKRSEISEHAFEYVAVDENGKVIKTKGAPKTGASDRQNLNLGIRFELPKYRMMENLDVDKIDENRLKEKGVNNFTDMICVGPNCQDISELKTVFTRVYDKGFAHDEEDAEEAVDILRDILSRRFPDIDEYKICMDPEQEKDYDKCDKKTRGIYFKRHEKRLDEMKKYAYCEAISGENFTSTMLNIFSNSFIVSEDQIVRGVKEEKTNTEETPKKSIFDWLFGGKRQTEETKQEKPKPKVREIGDFKDGASEYFALKIKESALTRITLVDERFFNDMRTRDQEEFLTCRNIRILNLKNAGSLSENTERAGCKTGDCLVVKDMFDGNDFCDGKDATHFLSIHLGMIEKIVKDDSAWVKAQHMESEKLTQRVNKLMGMIKKAFQTEQGELFISIHSGRGNFSKELDESLKEYRFISVSAIESVYSDSKFLLAQLFYNTVFMGKGELNEGKYGEEEN